MHSGLHRCIGGKLCKLHNSIGLQRLQLGIYKCDRRGILHSQLQRPELPGLQQFGSWGLHYLQYWIFNINRNLLFNHLRGSLLPDLLRPFDLLCLPKPVHPRQWSLLACLLSSSPGVPPLHRCLKLHGLQSGLQPSQQHMHCYVFDS